MVFDDFLFNIVKEQTNTVIFDNSKVSKLLIKPNGVDCILIRQDRTVYRNINKMKVGSVGAFCKYG